MEERKRFKEGVKSTMREQLGKAVSTIIEKHLSEMTAIIQKATDCAKATTTENEIFIGNVAEEARKGATFVAVQRMLENSVADIMEESEPLLIKLAEEFKGVVTEATQEVIRELFASELNKRLKS